MATIWTEEQKTEMQRLRDEGLSNADIGQRFGVAGDIIRKVLVRFQKRSAEPEMAEAAARQEGGEIGRLAGNRPATLPERTDSLRRLHDEFDTKAPRPDLHEKYCRVRNTTIARERFYAVCAAAAESGELTAEDIEVCFLQFLERSAQC